MSVAPVNCPRCGATLPPGAPEGLCPRCLGALNFATETVLTGEEKPAAQPVLTPEQLAAHFPQLEIIACLGRGGMGVVYQARQKSLNRLVALKLLAPERVQDARFAERFTHEAQALAKLSHPNIVTIHDFGEAGGFYFLLMEFVDGLNLRQLLRSRKLTPEEALAIVPPLCDALQYAHERGIVHRDIKPENLLLDKEGRIKIADFGIAKMLGAPVTPWSAEHRSAGEDASQFQAEQCSALQGVTGNTTAGTPGYMAPEQSSAPQKVDARADIYSLGVVFYEMLTGELPGAKLQPPSRKVQIDVRLDEIVLRALEQTPELRYATAAEFRTQIETLASSPANCEPQKPEPGTRIIKTGHGTFATPERLGTFAGQLFHYRTRGQFMLDDRQLTLSRGVEHTVIPLATIRDVSIGQYPRSMNPVGLDLLSLSYEQNGQRRHLYLSAMDGLFGRPSAWNARVAEWHEAICRAVQTATGRLPTTTPREQLPKLPGAPGLWLMITAPLVAVAVFGLILGLHHQRGQPWDWLRFLPLLFIMGGFAMVWLMPMLLQKGRRLRAFGILAGIAALIGFVVVRAVLDRPTASEAIKQVWFDPVGVSNNVVVVDISTVVKLWSAEMRAGLMGPHLTAFEETTFNEDVAPGFNAAFVKPMPVAGNQLWKLHPAGRHAWRVGFVLPTAEMARSAFENLQPFGPFTNAAGAGYATKLFTVRAPDGTEYRAEIQVAPPLHAGNPEWVSLYGQSSRSDTAMTMTWTVNASRSGDVKLTHDAFRTTTSLGKNSATKLSETQIRFELIRITANQVQLVRTMGGAKGTQALVGRYQDFAEELARTAHWSAKALRGEWIELCQFQGQPVMLRVEDRRNMVPPAERPPAIFTPAEVTVAQGGLAMLAPVVGDGIGSNVFRVVTTVMPPRHVAVYSFEVESESGRREIPTLSFWATSLDGTNLLGLVSQWTFGDPAGGAARFALTVERAGNKWVNRAAAENAWGDFEWKRVTPTRSFWVGAGEWNLNEMNELPIFEGTSRSDPNRHATARIKFGLYKIPDKITTTRRGVVIESGQQWRSVLGLETASRTVRLPTKVVTHSMAGSPGIVIWLALVIFVIGGVVVLVLLLRKRGSTAVKVLAVLGGVALLLFLLMAGLIFAWVAYRRAGASEVRAVSQQAMERLQVQAEQEANARTLNSPKNGPTAGLGIALSSRNGRFIVGSVIPNTPAARDGRVEAGDQIVAVEEEGRGAVYLDGMRLTEVIPLLRGEAGSVVKLFVRPGGQGVDEPVRIRLVRERLAWLEAETKRPLIADPPVNKTP